MDSSSSSHLVSQNITNKNNNHRKSLDKGEKQLDEQTKNFDKNENKKFSHSNGTVTTTTANNNNNHDVQLIERINHTINDYDTNEIERDNKNIKVTTNYTVKSQTNGTVGNKYINTTKENRDSTTNSLNNHRDNKKNKQSKNITDTLTEQQQKQQQDDYCQKLIICRKLESDVKKLKNELQTSRQCEQDLRSQLNNIMTCEKQVKVDLSQLQYEHEQLQNKLQNTITSRQIDKQTILSLEKRINEEKRQRTACETSLISERRARRVAEDRLSITTTQQQQQSSLHVRQECTDTCKTRRLQFEQEIKNLRRELKIKNDKCHGYEKETIHCKDNHGENDILLGALSALQDKNSHLENSLSAETRIKLDLFSALGEAKRQLEIRESKLF